MENISRIATPSSFVCPECHGALWRVKDADPPRFRCYTGHAYTLQALRMAQSEGTDAALWNALRALDEKHAILKELAASEHAPAAHARLKAAAHDVLEVAQRLRELIEAQPDQEQAAD